MTSENTESKYWPKKRTIETFMADKAFKDQIVQWLYATGYIHDDEEITKIHIDLPESITLRWTVKKSTKKGGAERHREEKEGL